MCDAKEIEAKLRESEELRRSIVRDLGSFTISILSLSESKKGEELRLVGTGTLVDAGGSHYILTAAHVWEEILKSSTKVGITLAEGIDHRYFIDVKTFVPSGPPKPETWSELGPDLIFLRIPKEHLGSINARRVFYSRAVDARTDLRVDHIEVWVLMGTPWELGTFTKTHADLDIRGFFVNTDPPRVTSGEYDYIDVEADATLPSAPTTFGGVSGGGLWKVLICCDCVTGKIDWARSLEGVAFWQFSVKDHHRVIRSHGPNSISAAMPTS